MKTLAYSLCTVLAGAMFFVTPARSEEMSGVGGNGVNMNNTKDECLLMAKNCSADTIQERIERITNEIKRGTVVYTSDELRTLENQLEEYKKDIQVLERNEG